MNHETPERKEAQTNVAEGIALKLDEIFGDSLDAGGHTRSNNIETLAQSINFMGQNTRERLKTALTLAERG